MRNGIKLAGLVLCTAVMGCAQVPRTSEEGVVEIEKVKASIACELAAAAVELPELKKWGAKSALDLTLVDTIGADGKIVWSIAYAGGPIKLTPSVTLSGRDTSQAHLDFSTSIPVAVNVYGKQCTGNDPSQTGLGLAAWLAATLKGTDGVLAKHGGMSYTREFQVTLAAGTRFGYTAALVTVDAGPGISRVGTNRLTVAVAPPPPPAKPLPVSVENWPDKEQGLLPKTERGGGRSPAVRRPPVDDSTLNRLLLQRAPVRIEAQ